MKELSIEEKAKRYDEAIERSKNYYSTTDSASDIKLIGLIFPELKESEDEKIRKDIIWCLKHSGIKESNSISPHVTTTVKDAITWLEKQVHVDEDEIVKGIRRGVAISLMNHIDANSKGMCLSNMECEDIENAIVNEDWDKVYGYMKKKLEKQSEQKPATNVELKFKVKYAGSEYNVFEVKDIAGVTFYGIEDEPNHIDYVKADNCEIISGYGIKESGLSFPTKPVMFSEQKSSWSEEDEYTLGETIQHLEELIRIDKAKHCACDVQYYQRDIDWLKSLKDRVVPQPKQEWKPSDEQMITLRHVISGCSYDIEPLAEMEEQLKKLRGE